MRNIILIFILLLISAKGFSGETNDTIKVFINLQQIDSLGFKVNVYPPKDLSGSVLYQFPRSVPGIYEYLKSSESYITLNQNGQIIKGPGGSYKLECDKNDNVIEYFTKSTKGEYNGVYGKDIYYLKDSIYILNWHYLLGFFQNETNRPYKIEIIKNKKLYGAGSLPRNKQNDTIDIYTANNYKELIHNPIMYSIPDTTSFKIRNTKFEISCAGNDTILNSRKIRELISSSLSEIIDKSNFKHKKYSFIYFSEYSLTPPYLRGLEHSKSTFISYHPALLDNNVITSASIHEYIHSIYSPLRIRSEVINEFNFINPKCDEFLWFYEGITEYLTLKTLVNSGFYEPQDFFKELNQSDKYHKNINLSKVSLNAYGKKEQELFDNFYTKGSLFAFQLDIELIKRSNGKTDLFEIMQKLQNLYTTKKAFNSKTFINDFSKVTGFDLQDFISRQTRKKAKINLEELCKEIGYATETRDTVKWNFNIKKNYLISNYKKERFEIAVFGSKINKELNSRRVTIIEINGEPLTWYNDKKILHPENELELLFKALTKSGEIEFTAKPDKMVSKYSVWIKNNYYESDIAKKFWN